MIITILRSTVDTVAFFPLTRCFAFWRRSDVDQLGIFIWLDKMVTLWHFLDPRQPPPTCSFLRLPKSFSFSKIDHESYTSQGEQIKLYHASLCSTPHHCDTLRARLWHIKRCSSCSCFHAERTWPDAWGSIRKPLLNNCSASRVSVWMESAHPRARTWTRGSWRYAFQWKNELVSLSRVVLTTMASFLFSFILSNLPCSLQRQKVTQERFPQDERSSRPHIAWPLGASVYRTRWGLWRSVGWPGVTPDDVDTTRRKRFICI